MVLECRNEKLVLADVYFFPISSRLKLASLHLKQIKPFFLSFQQISWGNKDRIYLPLLTTPLRYIYIYRVAVVVVILW